MYRSIRYGAVLAILVSAGAGCASASQYSRGRVAAYPAFVDSFAHTPSAANSAPLRTAVVAPGARVRVTAPPVAPEPLVGTVLVLDSDTLFLTGVASYQGKVAVPLAYVIRLEVSRGWSSLATEGAVLGAVAGGLIGLNGVGSNQWGPSSEDFVAIVGSAALGAGLGAAVGSVVGSEEWELVPLSRLRPRVSGGP